MERAREIIRKRWPAVHQALEEVQALRTSKVEHQGAFTFIAEGIHVTSLYNRQAEAKLQARQVPESSSSAWAYGVALGDVQREFLGRKALRRLNVVIMNRALLKSSFEHVEHGDWLADTRVELMLGSSQTAVQRPYAVAAATLRLAENEAVALRDDIALDLALPYQKRKYEEREVQITEYLNANMERIKHDGDVHSLFGTHAGKRIAVLAAGPTLQQNFSWLVTHRKDIVTVAVSTVLGPLQKIGMQPDYVVAIDAKPELIGHLEGIDLASLSSVPLIYYPVVSPDFLQRWPGPKICAYGSHPRYNALKAQHPRGDLFCAGTVTHTAVDLAVKMGASDVTLVGADFCYVDGQSHTQGAAFHVSRTGPVGGNTWVVNGHGNRVMTNLALVGYYRDLERYIAEHRQVRFVNASRDGAYISGTHWLEP